jgi:hypothetical protein
MFAGQTAEQEVQGETKPVQVQTNFNTELLSDFQSFVLNYFVYADFISKTTEEVSPSIASFKQDILDYQSGVKYNFSDYAQAISSLNNMISDCSGVNIATNLKNCDTAQTCITVADNSSADLSAQIAQEDCVEDKTQVISIFTALKKSLSSGTALYDRMLVDIDGLPGEAKWETPGYTSLLLRQALIEIEPSMAEIGETFKESFAILEKYQGDLSGLTNCYIAKRQVTLLETPVCFMFRVDLYNTMFWIFAMTVVVLLLVWSIFFSIKYSGNLSFGNLNVSAQTTVAGTLQTQGGGLSLM